MVNRLIFCLVAFSFFLYTSAQTSMSEYELPGDSVYPEGIAYSSETGNFYTGSTVDGKIFRGNLETSDVEIFVEGTNGDSPKPAYGMALDDQNRLWVVGGPTGTIYVYGVDTGESLSEIQTPEAEATFLNDVVVTQEGSAYITDSFRPILFKVPVTADGIEELESWLDFTGTPLTYTSGETVLENVNLNGITVTEDDRYLITVQMNTGELYRIEIESKEVTQIDLGGETVTNGDGLVLDGQTLYVVRIADNEVDIVELSEDFTSGTVEARFSDPAFIWPATAAKADDQLLVVNTQFNRQEQGNPDLPFSILSVPISMIEAGQGVQQGEHGTLEVSWVDPEDVTVSISGPNGYSDEAQVTGGQIFAELFPGTYELAASKEGYQSTNEQVEVQAGETTSTSLILQQQEGQQADEQQDAQGTLQLSWVDPADVRVSVSGPGGYSDETRVTGGQIFAELAPGTYELTASKEGYRSTSEQIEVQAGETASTSLILQQQEGEQTSEQQQEDMGDDQTQQEAEQEQESDQQTQEVSFETLITQGEQLYGQAGCSSCHGGEGGGSQGPRLAGSEQLQETPFVARIIIHGRGGMPGFGGRLSDEDIASVASYIRNSWGNDFGAVNPEEVEQQR